MTGNWIDIGVENQTVTLDMITVNIDDTAPYATVQSGYIVVPNVTAEQMPSIAANNAGLFVTYSTSVHAVLNASDAEEASQSGMMQAVFWEPSSVSFVIDNTSVPGWSVTASQPCMVIVDASASGSVTFTASNPDTPSLLLELVIDRVLTGEACVAAEDGATTTVTLQLPAFFGNSTSVTCL